MNTIRNAISWISLYLVGLLFFLSAGFFSIVSVVNPDAIKSALKDEGAYTAIVPAVLKTTADTNVSTGVLPIKEPWVQNAAETAFPASDLQQKTETVIDSTFSWLDGTTDKPEFSIDLTANKASFAAEVGKYTESRYTSLPACSRSTLPSNTDPLTINCQIQGISASTLSSAVSKQVVADPDFLPNPVLSSDNASLNPVNQKTNANPFDQFNQIRSVYQHKTLLAILLPLLTIVFAVIGLLLAVNRIKGFKRLSRSFLLSAISLVAIGLIIGVGLERVVDTLAIDSITSTVIGPVVGNLGNQAKNAYFIFAGIAVAISVITYGVARFLRQRAAAVAPLAPLPNPFSSNRNQ